MWVIDELHHTTRQVTPSYSTRRRPAVMFLHVDTEAGLLFASMAQTTANAEKRRLLRMKAENAYRTVQRLSGMVQMDDAERARLHRGLDALRAALAKLPA